jgi:hypothetical protein
VEFLAWSHHIEGLERMGGFGAQERREAKEALRYLQNVLGEDFLWRASAGDSCLGRHPLLRMLANFAPSSRRKITRFAGRLRILEHSQNFDKVLKRLADATQFDHDALLIKSASRLVGDGLRARFEPTIDVKNRQKQPDVRLDDPVSGETLFLEVTTQGAAQHEREATEANSAVVAALFGISYELCFSCRWEKTPGRQVLADILERIRRGAVRALTEGTIITVQKDDVLEMALCHQDYRASLLEPSCAERGLSSGGFLGPALISKDTVKIKRKIKIEQAQLPRDNANVIVILAPDAFLRAGGVRRVISEVEDSVFQYDHVHLVIVHGEYIDDREVPVSGHEREHRYTRRMVDGVAENDLLLFNLHARKRLSDSVLDKFRRLF